MQRKVADRDLVSKEDPEIPTSRLTQKVDLVPAFHFFYDQGQNINFAVYPGAKASFIMPHVKLNEIFYPLENTLCRAGLKCCLRGLKQAPLLQPPYPAIIMVTITKHLLCPVILQTQSLDITPQRNINSGSFIIKQAGFSLCHRGFIIQAEI